MSACADVLVIGAGIVGAACAQALAAAGLTVRVIDAQLRGATAAGMGHLTVMDDNAAELALSRASLALWQQWGARLRAEAPDCQYTDCGTLWVAADDAEMAEAQAKARRLRAHGVACELLDAAQLARAEPLLRVGLAGALRVAGDALIYAPNVVQWLLASDRSAITFEAARVERIERGGVRLADGSRRSAGAVLLAAGLESKQLAPDLPLVAKKGHLAITDRYVGLLSHQVVELGYVSSAHHATGTSVACNLQPRPTGQVLIGSSRQFDSDDAVVEPAVLARMLQRALAYAPSLAKLNVIRTWTGLRAATPDGLPLIGAHPGIDGLWLATGHEGLGVTSAPATAQLIAALMQGGTPGLDAAPYAPARFACEALA